MFGSSCTFPQCLVPCLIVFCITLVVLGLVHIWIYFKLVKYAKKRYGEYFTGTIVIDK